MSVDAVVVGGGANGLAAALMLARTGRSTVVLDARDAVGGLCAGAEFHPGYRHVGHLHDSDTVRPAVVDGLALTGLAFAPRAAVGIGGPDGGLVFGDDPATVSLGPAAEGFARWRALCGRVAPLVAELVDRPPPRIDAAAPLWPLAQRAITARRAGAALLQELMRRVPGSIEDALSDLLVDRRLRAGVALGGLHGTFMGPRSPQSAGILLLREALAGPSVVGGPAAFVAALASAATTRGVELRPRSAVARIRVRGGAVVGVTLRDGTEIDARIVVSALDPRATLLGLVEGGALPIALEEEARAQRVRTTSAKLFLALSRAPKFCGRDGLRRFRVADDPDHLERAFDDAKHGRMPGRPALDVVVPTLDDLSLAPAGHHVASIDVFGVPAAPAGGWTQSAREQLQSAVIALLAAHDPELPAAVVGAELVTAVDVAERYGVTGGHPMHGEHALDQLWFSRPGIGLAGHATPVKGLFLGSGGTHPHGWVGGASGWFAGRAAVEE
ncbi:MAG: NAD(P)/FAD-dependent oxidoreductase [Myxococcota bacterium]